MFHTFSHHRFYLFPIKYQLVRVFKGNYLLYARHNVNITNDLGFLNSHEFKGFKLFIHNIYHIQFRILCWKDYNRDFFPCCLI